MADEGSDGRPGEHGGRAGVARRAWALTVGAVAITLTAAAVIVVLARRGGEEPPMAVRPPVLPPPADHQYVVAMDDDRAILVGFGRSGLEGEITDLRGSVLGRLPIGSVYRLGSRYLQDGFELIDLSGGGRAPIPGEGVELHEGPSILLGRVGRRITAYALDDPTQALWTVEEELDSPLPLFTTSHVVLVERFGSVAARIALDDHGVDRVEYGNVVGGDDEHVYTHERGLLKRIRVIDGVDAGAAGTFRGRRGDPAPLGRYGAITIWARDGEIFGWDPTESHMRWHTSIPEGLIQPTHHRPGYTWNRVPRADVPLGRHACWVPTHQEGPASDRNTPNQRGPVVCLDLESGEVTFQSASVVADFLVRHDLRGTRLVIDLGPWEYALTFESAPTGAVRLPGNEPSLSDGVDMGPTTTWIIRGEGWMRLDRDLQWTGGVGTRPEHIDPQVVFQAVE